MVREVKQRCPRESPCKENLNLVYSKNLFFFSTTVCSAVCTVCTHVDHTLCGLFLSYFSPSLSVCNDLDVS